MIGTSEAMFQSSERGNPLPETKLVLGKSTTWLGLFGLRQGIASLRYSDFVSLIRIPTLAMTGQVRFYFTTRRFPLESVTSTRFTSPDTRNQRPDWE